VLERTVQFAEIKDEDGDACEDVKALSGWVLETIKEVIALKNFSINAVNFSTYGASFVYLSENGEVIAPLYNYLKVYPTELKDFFYKKYGGEKEVSLQTSSPVLGNLNAGMQLYRLKNEQPELFSKIKYALHLPQYISYLLTYEAMTDITSIGCHTQLWDFEKHTYHDWVKKEEIEKLFPPVFSSSDVKETIVENKLLKVGVGLHDSSAALIPYLANFTEPFILISTGTWCISFNPFNREPLTSTELENDCLCYMEYNGQPVKASRLFAGQEHETQVKRLADHFGKNGNYYTQVSYDSSLVEGNLNNTSVKTGVHTSGFENESLDKFDSFEQAYHRLIQYIMAQQFVATNFVMSPAVTRIFVDGGFSKNPVYMNLLSSGFPGKEIFAATVSQATAVGAALAIHKHWNSRPVAADMIELKLYATAHKTVV